MRTTLAIGLVMVAGCGPAPYTIGPEEPAGFETQGPPVTVVAIQGASGEQAPQAGAPSAAVPAPPADRWSSDGLPRPNPFVDHRTYVGTYECPQGITQLTFRVVDVRGKKVRAIFDFHHAPTNVSGQFMMAGTFDEQTGRVALIPGTWIIHPDDYETVAMIGRTTLDGSRFDGKIASRGCRAFHLHAAN
jgi:hypothetical protein